ncbi:MAG: sugar phosphate isomerase/epimerase [Candidatus Eremiobacteraeota bacterium]|nr:sugar phosphate isomerase/epimerase [Candidatus Eremiobacteraeota bacterium]
MKNDSRFGVSEFTTWPWSFERDVERYAAHGAAAIEVCEFKLDRNDYAPQLESIVPAGLTVSSVQSTVHSIFPDSLAPQPTAPEDRIRHIREAIERISPHVPENTPFVAITGAAPGGNTERVYERCLKAFDELAGIAQKHHMRLAFEPLNPVLFNTDTALWGLEKGRELIERVGHPALGLCVDTWNIFETPHLEKVIADCGDRIFIVQVSQWERPRSGADRRNLGQGTIDDAAIVRAVRATGYSGYYALEIFSSESLPDSLWRGDMDATLETNVSAFADLWERSAP